MLERLLESPMVQFAFVATVPIVATAGAIVSLFAMAALLDALDHPEQLARRVDALFRRPPRDPKPTGAGHYYRPYWAR